MSGARSWVAREALRFEVVGFRSLDHARVLRVYDVRVVLSAGTRLVQVDETVVLDFRTRSVVAAVENWLRFTPSFYGMSGSRLAYD
jgi:hypothetical protein